MRIGSPRPQVFRFAVVALVDNFLVIIRITAALCARDPGRKPSASPRHVLSVSPPEVLSSRRFCVCNNLLYPILAFYSLGIESSKAAKVGHACTLLFHGKDVPESVIDLPKPGCTTNPPPTRRERQREVFSLSASG